VTDPDDGSADPAGPDRAAEPPDSPAERRRRRAAVFGEVLPEATSDERGDGWSEQGGDADDWLRRQVPPHHG
jgi:hypothetical protein